MSTVNVMIDHTPPQVRATFQATFRKLITVNLNTDHTLTFDSLPPFGQWQEISDGEGRHGPLQKFRVTWHWTGKEAPDKMKTHVFCRVAGTEAWADIRESHDDPRWQTMYMFPVTRPSELARDF